MKMDFTNEKRKNSSASCKSENENENEKSSQGIFKSVGLWGIKDNLLSGLSSKLEAALHASFDAAFTDSNAQDNDKLENRITKSSTSSSFPRKTKDRSVFGQPEITNINQSFHRNKDKSSDSLDTLDSGQSMGENSYASASELKHLELYDPLKFYRTDESVGIGSGQSTSLESSDAEEFANDYYSNRCNSQNSIKSWASSLSCDSQAEEFNTETKNFMKSFVGKIFCRSNSISLEEKAKFGEVCRNELGRLWFARYINDQRCQSKRVSESTFYSLAQYFALMLFECAECDDFIPAKTIMNMCFTYYHETNQQNTSQHTRQYLYYVLREQPIWRSLRFWNAAFFDAVQCERRNRPTPTRLQLHQYSKDDMQDEAKFQENITFGQLGAFTHNMHSFGLSKEFCLEFLRKQCTIANLKPDQIALLRENIERMYAYSSKSIN